MKALFKNINKFLFAGIFFSTSLFAKDIAVVQELYGNAFGIRDGKVRTLQRGDVISDLTEVVTEEGSQISLSDFYDHKFHLSGSGNIKFFNKTIELKKGYLWLQSYQNSDAEFWVHTANSHVKYNKGEGIISFDINSGRTQVMTLDGTMYVKNPLLNTPEVDVPEGAFSVVDKEYEAGQPRWATKVGYNSFMKIMQLFSSITPIDKNNRLLRETMASQQKRGEIQIQSMKEENKRGPASEKESLKPGKIIFLNVNQDNKKSMRESMLHNDSLSKLKKYTAPKPKKKFAPTYQKVSNVKLRVFGKPHITKAKAPPKRPIVKVEVPKVNTREVASPPSSGFESSLMDSYKKQLKHDTEVNQLIDRLKSFKKDYKKSY